MTPVELKPVDGENKSEYLLSTYAVLSTLSVLLLLSLHNPRRWVLLDEETEAWYNEVPCPGSLL